MPNINFPTSPTLGQVYTFSGSSWTYNGTAWVLNGSVGPQGPQGPQGSTGPQGNTIGSLGITVDGGGIAVTTGSKGYVIIPYNATINNWYITSDVSGSIVVDIKRSGSSIVGAGNKPTLSAASYATAAVSGWTSTSITAGDVFEFSVDSASTVTKINLVVKITKT